MHLIPPCAFLQMGGLADQKGGILSVDQLELQYYEAQLELYDIKFEILKNEELLLVAQIDTVRRQMKGINAKKHTHRHTLTHTNT